MITSARDQTYLSIFEILCNLIKKKQLLNVDLLALTEVCRESVAQGYPIDQKDYFQMYII